MKTQILKTIFTMFFFIVCLTINAQVTTNAKKSNTDTLNEKNSEITDEKFIHIIVQDPENQQKSNVTGILNLQVNTKEHKDISYKLYDTNGILIKSNPIKGTHTAIPLHNVEAENYVLNVVKGNQNIKTFGFYH